MRATPRLAAIAAGALLMSGLAALPAATAAPRAVPTAVSVFPDDALTVADRAQKTGRRVAIPTAGCGPVTVCGLAERVNELDGFDLDPRLALRFDRPVEPSAVARATTVRPVAGGRALGVDRVVYDAATSTVYAHPQRQLEPGTTYRLRVQGRDLGTTETTFTTLSATDGMLDLVDQIERGRAYRDAGIANRDRGLRIDAVVPAAGTTLEYVQDRGTTGGLVPTAAPSLAAATAGSYVFGSFDAPQWVRPDRTIAQTPTRDGGPAPVGAARLPFLLVLPTGTAPRQGWPVALFGHGFTRSDGDVLLAGGTNAARGIATLATHVVGHGFGPRSTWRVTTAGGAVQDIPAYGRGLDLEGDGIIGSTEGVSPLPTSPAAAVGSRDGLRQTSADVSTLLRAVQRGLDVDGDGRSELRPGNVGYFGQSFGGIYGTILSGSDPQVSRSVLNVAGGPVTEIARLSPAFRPLTTQALLIAGLLNGGTNGGFTESMPLPGEPPVLAPAPGALAIQDYLADSTWLTRPGSPETFAPLVRRARVLYQVARGDATVPNPTSATVLDAGDLFPRTSLYRNDLTPRAGSNPHGFLLDPTFAAGFLPGQSQIATFLTTGATVDPDGAGPVWETPIADRSRLQTLGFPAAPPAPPAVP